MLEEQSRGFLIGVMVYAHNFEVFLRDGVFNNAGRFSCRRKSGVVRLPFPASVLLDIASKQSVECRISRKPRTTCNHQEQCPRKPDRLLAAGVSQGEEIKASGLDQCRQLPESACCSVSLAGHESPGRMRSR